MSIFSKIFGYDDNIIKKPAQMANPAPAPEPMIDEALDKNNPGTMIIDDVFSITERGTVATGQVTSGYFYVGQNAVIAKSDGQEMPTTVLGLESFRKIHDYAGPGQNVGILLKDIERGDIDAGDEIRGIAE